MNLFKALRPLPLMHNWVFWFDRYSPDMKGSYQDQLVEIAEFNTVKDFWRIYNNLPMEIGARDSIHMFKKGVKPRWEDPRNEKGGCWNFRMQPEKSTEFFVHILLLLIGESLTDTLSDGDDICGVSLSIRFNVNMVALWNRKAPHSLPSVVPVVGNLPVTHTSLSVVQEEDETSVKKLGIENMRGFILAGLPPGLMPQRWSYRVHSSHKDFNK